MGMAKAFGLFPTIYQEYNQKNKYIVSIYFLLISWSVTLTINAHTLHTFTPIFLRKLPYTKLFLLLTTIIQFILIQHSIVSLSLSLFHQILILIDIPKTSISTFTTIIQFTVIQHNILSLFFHQALIQIDILKTSISISTFNNYYTIYIHST